MNAIAHIAVPAGFAVPMNAGLHGDMQFFEMKNHQFTASEPVFSGDTVAFVYTCFDSDEGVVIITFENINGDDARGAMGDAGAGWDVEVVTGSDTWGLRETRTAVDDAIALHEALGRMMGRP